MPKEPTSSLTSNSTAHSNPGNLLQLGLSFWGSRAFLSAVELDLFSVLADGPLSEIQLRGRLELNPRSSRDFFDALVALGVLRRADGKYSNTEETAMFLDRAKPGYIGGLFEMAAQRLYPFWAHLTEALRTGQPQNELKNGSDFFGELYSNPQRLRTFLTAMTGVSMGSARMIATKFPWQGYESFVDVGGAQGGVAAQVALANPHLKGMVFDLPQVEPVCREYLRSLNLDTRVRFQSGDFFNEPLPRSDVLIMGHILHDWDLEQKLTLLRKAYAALPQGGALIVFESMIDDNRSSNAAGLLMSLNMLIETPGGFDYTAADCKEWLTSVGFRDLAVEPLGPTESMVIARK
jgi:O-methyltransferase domain/Dimerisation domain